MLCPGMEEWHEEPPEELNMEPGRKEMWDFGRAATGYDDDALSSMLAPALLPRHRTEPNNSTNS